MAQVLDATTSKLYIVYDKESDLIGVIKADSSAEAISEVALGIDSLRDGDLKTVQTVTTATLITE